MELRLLAGLVAVQLAGLIALLVLLAAVLLLALLLFFQAALLILLLLVLARLLAGVILLLLTHDAVLLKARSLPVPDHNSARRVPDPSGSVTSAM